ncbi:pentapeptide repeat-containing protein [Streptomyces griseorubiginosus]|uniref:pentapeptide repeat-containing protein n=1 Tax=Streptomyces griseorubiginosus TaxID=67304 RepID=UPI0036442729
MVTDAERAERVARLRGLLYLACPDADPGAIDATAAAIADRTKDSPGEGVGPAARLAEAVQQPNPPRLNLSGADLTGADLTRATLSGADLTGADLTRATLSGADLTDADLTRANLTRANLSGADLTGADLYSTILREADLTGADLTGVSLRRACLAAADLTRAVLLDTHLVNATWSEQTLWPAGVASQIRARSVPLGSGQWRVQGSGNSSAELGVPPPVPVH